MVFTLWEQVNLVNQMPLLAHTPMHTCPPSLLHAHTHMSVECECLPAITPYTHALICNAPPHAPIQLVVEPFKVVFTLWEQVNLVTQMPLLSSALSLDATIYNWSEKVVSISLFFVLSYSLSLPCLCWPSHRRCSRSPP